MTSITTTPHGDASTAPARDLLPWAMLALAWLAYAYFGLVVGALPALIGTIEDDLGLSGTQAGVLLGAFPLMYIVSALATGKLADLVGVKRIAVAGILVLALSAVLRGPADTFPTVLGATALVGIGGPVVSTVLPKLVGQWFDGGRRTLAAGIYTTGPAVGAGVALAGNETLLDAAGSWHRVFVIYGVVGFGVAAAWAVLARQPPPAPEVPAGAGHGATVWRSPAVWCVVVVGMSVFAMGQGFSSWLPKILTEQGFRDGTAGLLAAGQRICSVVGALAVPFFVGRGRAGRRRATIVACLLLAAASVASLALGNHVITVVSLVVQGLAAGALLPLLLATLLDLPEVDHRTSATAAGLYFTVGQIAGSVAPIGVGWLEDATGSFTSGIVIVAAVVAVMVVPARRLAGGA